MSDQVNFGTIFFVDTTLRDGHLSLWASNMRTGMMLPVAERLDRAGFEAVEVMILPEALPPFSSAEIDAHEGEQ